MRLNRSWSAEEDLAEILFAIRRSTSYDNHRVDSNVSGRVSTVLD